MRSLLGSSLVLGVGIAGALCALAPGCGAFLGLEDAADASANGSTDAGSDAASDAEIATADGAQGTDGGCGAWAPIDEGFDAIDVPQGWTEGGGNTGITLSRDTVTRLSGASSLRITNPGVTGRRFFQRPIALAPGAGAGGCSIRVKVAVRRESGWPLADSGAVLVVIEAQTASLAIGINRDGYLEVGEQELDGNPYRTLGVAEFEGDVWKKVDVTWDIAAGTVSFGVEAVQVVMLDPPEMLVGQTPAKIDVGAVWMDVNAKGVWIDELSVE